MERYEGKRAVITGGTSGMGLATAKMLLDGGARVLVTGRSSASLESAQKELGKDAIVVSSDARSLTDIDALTSRVKTEFETFDLLFANAGFGGRAPLESMTISDVFSRLNFKQFSLAFVEWVEASLPTLNGQHIAIDGKTLRGSRDSDGADHVVGAFASAGRWALAQEAVREKSNEIDAIPRLLSLPEIKGATITIDAMGCQRGIAEVIVAAEADYVLALKENQPSLYADAQAKIDAAVEAATLPIYKTLDKDHGRIETRRYCILQHFIGGQDQSSGPMKCIKIHDSARLAGHGRRESAVTDLTGIAGAQKWKGLKGIGMVESSREIIGKETTVERRYYVCSNPDLPHFAEHVRSHWAIEAHHLILDVQFGEDKNRTRKDFSAKNLAVVRRMALNFLHADKDEKNKRSIRTRKMIALLDDNYRTALLSRAA